MAFLAIVSLFALDPHGFGRSLLQLEGLERARRADRLVELIVETIAALTGQDRPDVEARILDMTHRIRNLGYVVAPLVTFVAPVPPWLPPKLPAPDEFDTYWQESRGGQASQLYRSSFAFPGPQSMSFSALARRDASGSLVSRHDLLPSGRAMTGIFGHGYPPLAPPSLPESSGILSDHDIDATSGTTAFQVWASDCFGRFGAPIAFDSYPPPRPMPPKPVLRYSLELSPVDPGTDSALSPGTLVVMVAVPAPWPHDRFADEHLDRLGSAVVVKLTLDKASVLC